MSATQNNNYRETDLGNVSPNPRGEYSDTEVYEFLDLVSYQGGSYLCTIDLNRTIKGVNPTPGQNTDTWQMLTLPGSLTEEYVEKYKEVLEKAKQAEASCAAAELCQQEVNAAQLDVEQMRQDAQKSMQSAEDAETAAKQSAQSAEASRTAAAESEKNAAAQVQGFDDHVVTKKQEAATEITVAKETAINEVTAKGKEIESDLNSIKDTAAKHASNAQGYANTASSAASAAQSYASNADTSSKSAATSASKAATALADVKTIQEDINATKAKNDETAKNIEANKSSVENTKKEIDQLKEQIKTNTDQALTDITTAKEAAVKKVSDTGAEQVEAINTEGEKQVQIVKDTMPNELDKKVDKSTLYDVLHNTPRAETAGDFFNLKRTGKIYRTRIPLFETNPTTVCEKLLDNAGLNFTPYTDTTEGEDDYLNGDHPLFEWYNCNYKRNDDGSPYPVAIEGGDADFSYTGNVDVGTIQMSFYYEFTQNVEGYVDLTISDMPHTERSDMNLQPWSECVTADGTVLPYCIGSKYVSSLGDDGLLRSVKDGKPEKWQSHNNMVTNYAKKGKGYHGAGAERNTFQIIFNLIKGAQKSSQKLYAGTISYNFQYKASIQRSEKETYFPVTNGQANNFIVGSCVSVGYGVLNTDKTGVNNDRGSANLHKYADNVRITKIETLDDNNKAIYLDIDEGFDTMPVALSDTVNADIMISTMHWKAGETDKVIGKHDGSPVSNTNGRYPYRVQGREYAVGTYIIASDTVMIFQSDYSKDVYVAQKGTTRSTSEGTIKSTYKRIGNIPAYPDGKGADYWIGDIAIDIETGAWFPSTKGSGDAQGMGDILYAGGAGSGYREYPMGGSLGNGSSGGSACLACWVGLSGASWRCCCCD